MLELVLGTISVIRRVFRNGTYRAGFSVLTLVIFASLFLLQVGMIPGNSIRMQLALFGSADWVLLAAVSALNALFIVVQRFTILHRGVRRQNVAALAGFAVGGVSTSSAIFASVFGSATCGLCATALFGFLGANTVMLLISYRLAITVGAMVVLVTALIFTAQRFTASCVECKIDAPN